MLNKIFFLGAAASLAQLDYILMGFFSGKGFQFYAPNLIGVVNWTAKTLTILLVFFIAKKCSDYAYDKVSKYALFLIAISISAFLLPLVTTFTHLILFSKISKFTEMVGSITMTRGAMLAHFIVAGLAALFILFLNRDKGLSLPPDLG